jgi:hypothetical protein
MAKFCLVMRQSGEGCDYTIGCGFRWEIVHADALEEALSFAKDTVLSHGWGPDCVSMAFLLPADGMVDLGPLLDADKAAEAAEAASRDRISSEARERAEYERLKGKFG